MQGSNANTTTGARADTARRFAGSWEWLGCAIEGRRLVLSHLKSRPSSASPVLLDLSVHELPAPAGTIDAQGLWSFLRATDSVRRSPRKPISLVLAGSQYQLLLVGEPELRAPTEAQRREALRWVLQDLVHFPVEDASLDIIADASQGARQILVAAASAEVIAPLVREADLQRAALAAIDVPESVQRNVAHLFEEPGQPLGLLNVVGHQALLTLSVDGELLVTRRIDAVREAESLEQAIVHDDGVRDRIGLEVLRTLDNFERQSGRGGLSRLLLGCGPHAQVLARHLQNLFGFRVEPLGPEGLQQVLEIPTRLQSPLQDWSGLHLLALGAALRGEDRS